MNQESILGKHADEIARLGLFLAFQYPVEVSGVSIANFIRAALNARLPDGESNKAVDYLEDIGVSKYKIGSGDLNNKLLLKNY